MDYAKAFTYTFEEDNWITKFLIGVVVSLVPIINLAGFGYLIQVLKNVRDGDPQPLPEWDEFGKFFFDGLKFFAGTLVYFLPVIFLSLLTIPLSFLAGDEPGALFGLTITAISCLTVIFAILPTMLMPALAVQYAERDEIRDMFAFSDMWEMIKADLATYIIILLLLGFVLSFVGSIGLIACGIGVFFTTWYAYLVGGHILGQYAQKQPGIEKTI